MRRRLILIRHAKSSWTSDAASDHDRPLSNRGRRDAPRVAAYLRALGWIPDLVVCSDAVRARQTWEYMRPEFGTSIPMQPWPDFYHAGPRAIRAAGRGWSKDLETIAVVGHNPGWERALAAFAGEDLPMTTGNAALLEARGATWADALAAPMRLHELVQPRSLKR